MNNILVKIIDSKIYGPNDKWKRLFWKKSVIFKRIQRSIWTPAIFGTCFLMGSGCIFDSYSSKIQPNAIKKHLLNMAVAQIDRWICLKMTDIFYKSYLLVFSEVKARRKNQREARKAAAEQMIQRIQQELECAKLI